MLWKKVKATTVVSIVGSIITAAIIFFFSCHIHICPRRRILLHIHNYDIFFAIIISITIITVLLPLFYSYYSVGDEKLEVGTNENLGSMSKSKLKQMFAEFQETNKELNVKSKERKNLITEQSKEIQDLTRKTSR